MIRHPQDAFYFPLTLYLIGHIFVYIVFSQMEIVMTFVKLVII